MPLFITPELELARQRAAQYRLQRTCDALRHNGCAAILLYNPINIRYATDSSNMQVWTSHNVERYALVFADQQVVLFDFHGCDHLSEGNAQIDEIRSAISCSYFGAGDRQQERALVWAKDLHEQIVKYLGAEQAQGAKIAIDINLSSAAQPLAEYGYQIVDGDALMEQAKLIKSEDELTLMRHATAVTDLGLQRMYDELRPGITENQLWAFLHFENIQHGGEWIETRLLSSGPRTNPWMQESSDREMQLGEIICFDTDLIGPFGYCVDISRAWTVGHVPPTDEQRQLYQSAHAQIQHNQKLLRAGLSYREFSQQAWQIPERYFDYRYCCIAHGVGMADESPAIAHAGKDWDTSGYDGEFQKNMVLSIESFIGERGGQQGIKLEQQVIVTDHGCEVMSSFPFEQDWLN